MSICAVVPAAGNGTRLGSEDPKVFTKVSSNKVVWDFLYENIKGHVDAFNLIVKPGVGEKYSQYIKPDTHISNQDNPLGMGDAIFKGYDYWKEFDHILIVWGDQINLSSETLKSVTKSADDKIVLPLVKSEKPYVDYVFEDGKLVKVLQSREGDKCRRGGFSDIGVFLLPTSNLKNYWSDFLNLEKRGNKTGEINFLPFFSFLNTKCNVDVRKIFIEDECESRGLNTKEDLKFFQDKMGINL